MTETSLSHDASDRRQALLTAEQTLRDEGVVALLVQAPDLNGSLRTKITPLRFSIEGEAFNAMLYASSPADGAPVHEPLYDGVVGRREDGFANILALPDPDTVRWHRWDQDFASVFLNTYLPDGSACPVDPRYLLRLQQRRAEEMGFEARFGLEYECTLFHADDALVQAGRFDALTPYGGGAVNYDLHRDRRFPDLAAALMARLDALGIRVAGIVSEYGQGIYEIALGAETPLLAADNAMRMKSVLRQLCAERGLLVTFMARSRPPGSESGCGLHHHQSLWRDGQNVFAEGSGLSALGCSYLAGLLSGMRDAHLLFRPTINAYRRMDREAWSPDRADWGIENRMSAVRVIPGATSGMMRLEHRVPGADVNPYLTIAAMLAAGLDGIQNAAVLSDDVGDLPGTIKDSLTAWEESERVTRWFGTAFCTHMAARGHAEVAAFEQWLMAHVTGFEYQRYFHSV
ncbi:Glutamine synthetase [Granulibacter bethesdensis]|uniref:Glutamine synthetase n=1 Tax=Granulibacter bethesdensis TaxID=364410 RepID=A0AAN0RD40_9PROT|nr:glutamine synthetase family protein [Granulibacter bethesdensis]AHJ62602.1 Glutamine synthetase [Granulibacter bethesdensis]